MDRQAFLADDRTTDSVVRNLEVIGEAASRLPEDLRNLHPDIPWRRIAGLRNRIIHEYFDVDLELLWEVLATELPALKAQLQQIRQTKADMP